ncbi:unnamed protein product, partial [Rotaria magnacalcarata]
MNLGETYREMKDYLTALTYFQKGLKIHEEILAKRHPDLAAIYRNMSKLYFSTQQYSMAMKYDQQAVEIGQEKLTTTHPHLLEYREIFEKIRRKQLFTIRASALLGGPQLCTEMDTHRVNLVGL